uniref:poly(A)-specific ribonuclease n=1 Tax=Oncorhynchus kisutch TaxID=8019 RepID=A0A8C7J6S6_ONCKI
MPVGGRRIGQTVRAGSHVGCSSFCHFGVRYVQGLNVQELRLHVFIINNIATKYSLPPSECRSGQKSEQFSVDSHPPDGSTHQRQQPESHPARHRQAATPGLPEPVVQQAPQLARRTRKHGVSQGVAFKQQSFASSTLRTRAAVPVTTLGLKGNPLSQDILNLYQESDGTRKLLNYMLDNLAVHPEQLPQRPWITLKERDPMIPTAMFTVMCYNVLCDKYATRQLYGYCPSWALNWEYRKKGIMEEITHCDADIISLQEVETEQYHALFLETLKDHGYEGYFCPKSRAKLVSEQERKHVDGCAVFFKTEKFTLVQKHTVEFNQVAMANSEGSEVMLNRVMTKDNIGVAVLLEVNKDMFSGGMKPLQETQFLLVANAHMHWDPEFCDVKLIQTMMFLSELKSITERALSSVATGSPTSDPSSIPIVLCADLNSLPDSGVVEYLSNGGVAENHKDFRELRYNEALSNFSCQGKNGPSDGSITHSFQLKSAYQGSLMSYTNYTYDFKGVIDYIFFSKTHMSVAGLLGPLESQWLTDNNITGCPHPHIPSDHFSLLAQLELHPPVTTSLNGLHLPVHRNPC